VVFQCAIKLSIPVRSISDRHDQHGFDSEQAAVARLRLVGAFAVELYCVLCRQFGRPISTAVEQEN